MSRTKSSIYNVMSSLVGQLLNLILNFILRIIFIRYLAIDYLGVNGLFANILTIFSLVELGFGSSIQYLLYKPIADADKQKIKSYMKFYKKVYFIVGILILLLGLGMLPFYKIFMNEVPDIKELNLIYILFVLNSSITYFFSYKRTLIICDQKKYIVNFLKYIVLAIRLIVQIIILVLYKNYILFLIVQIIFTIIENIVINIKANRMYPYLKDKNVKKLSKKEHKEIRKNCFAMLSHKVGGTVVTSTDNILISKFIGVVTVGIYSNYYLVTQALEVIIGQFFDSLLASVGNLATLEDNKRLKDIFNKVFLINYWICCLTTICLIVLFNDFIILWVGKKYLLNMFIVLLISIIFYITCMRKTLLLFRNATGLFYQDRYKPIITSILNLVLSILFIKLFGLAGVFIGTIIAMTLVTTTFEAYVVYKYSFNETPLNYFKIFLKYTFIGILIGFICYKVVGMIVVTNVFLFILKSIITLLFVNIILYVIFLSNRDFISVKNVFLNFIKKDRK